MYAKKVMIENKTGLHARPASDFTNAAKNFKSKVYIQNMDEPDSAKANAKSIIMLIAQGLAKGTTVEISAEGEDEEEAVKALAALIQSKFGEE